MVLRMGNGPEFIPEALQGFCAGPVGIAYIPPGTPWNNGFIESFNNRLRDECLNRNCWPTLLEARVVIDDFKDDHNRRHRHSVLGYQTPAEYAGTCTHEHHPRGLRDRLTDSKRELALELPGTAIGGLPAEPGPPYDYGGV